MRLAPRSLLVCASVLCAASALAQGTAVTEAESLFQQARALLRDGRFTEACPLLERSNRLAPSNGTLLNLAVCHERVGRTATAWIEFQQALTAARVAGDTDRERFAADRLEVLTPRVPWVRIVVTGTAPGESLAVTLDGMSVPTPALGSEMPVDPGPHLVAVRGARELRETPFSLADGQRHTLAIDLGGVRSAQPPPLPPARPPADDRSPQTPPKREPRPWVIELGALGGLQLGDDRADLLVGGTLFAAYRPSERWNFGARGIGGGTPDGGYAAAGGPALSVRVAGPLWTGLWIGAGQSATRVRGEFIGRGHFETGFAPAGGLEVGLAMTESPAGALYLQALPTVFLGDEQHFLGLLGLSYRFW